MRLPTAILFLLSVASLAAAEPVELPRVRLEPFIRKLDRPMQITHDPLGRLVVLEQPGRASFVEADGKVLSPPYLDLTKEVVVDYECGLLGIAFHPKFADNGYLYVNYTAKAPNLKTFVSEFRADPRSRRVDLSTRRVVLTVNQPFNVHNGGQIQFGPDGMLYVGMGDGGSQHDPDNYGQRTDVLLAKMLRIDVTPREGYAVPKDNPFVGVKGARPEIWALGLRNPWRFSFDRETGLLYAGDVGQDTWEEVDVIEKGGNYGWPIREGNDDHRPVEHPPKMSDPIFQYSHNHTAAGVIGGCVYRGRKIPSLVGWYLFGDHSTGRIYGLKYEGGKVVASGVLIEPTPAGKPGERPTQPCAFGADGEGEMFLCDVNGPVYRIVARS